MQDDDRKADPLRLAGLAFFRDLPHWAVDRIAQSATVHRAAVGQVLLRQYDRASTVFVLLSGAVQVLIRVGSDDLVVGTLRGEGQLLGWSTFGPADHYTASVRCEEPTAVVRIPATVFEELFEEDPRVAHAILSQVAAGVAERYEFARELLCARPRRGPVGADSG